jgi:hypothetical protein
MMGLAVIFCEPSVAAELQIPPAGAPVVSGTLDSACDVGIVAGNEPVFVIERISVSLF